MNSQPSTPANPEWTARYRLSLHRHCIAAIGIDAAFDPDNCIAMQSRMLGESPESAAQCVAEEIQAWATQLPYKPHLSNSHRSKTPAILP